MTDARLHGDPRLVTTYRGGEMLTIGSLFSGDGRQYVSRSYGPWEAAGVQPMDGQEPLL